MIRNSLPFAQIPEWLLTADVSDRAVRLYAVLVRHADRNGRSHPSRRHLAELLRCSADSVDRAVGELVAVGALEVRPRIREDGSRASNDYVLHPEAGAAAQTEAGEPTGPAAPMPRGGRTDAQGASRTGAAPRTRASMNEIYTPPESPSDSHPPHGGAAGGSASPAAQDEAFAAFWEIYPRRVGKRAARAAFERAARRASVDAILEGARRFAADPNLPETRFVPHPTTWLNQDRWEDDPLPPRVERPYGRGDPAGRNRAFAILEQAARMRAERLRREGARGSSAHEGPRPPLEVLVGGEP